MKTIEINGLPRTETGKKFTKQCRKNDQVPAVIYGRDVNAMIVLNERDLKPVVYTPNVHIVNITIEGKAYETVVKDIQFHPVTDKILHIDFLHIFDDKKVTVSLPVIVKGQAEGAKEGGKVLLITRKLRASGFPQDLPETLEIDVTNLSLGKSVKVGDLNYDNVQLIDLKSTVVVSCQMTRAARGTQAAEETAAPAAAAAAPAAEE